MTANIAFSIGAAALSLAIVLGAALKGDWWVAAVYALLIAGFIARASFGRRSRRERQDQEQQQRAAEEPAPGGPEHQAERQLRKARFKRR
jgi:membrane protein implicated in regulation of membrane protease activity